MRIGINCIDIDPNYSGGINSFTFGLIKGFVSLSSAHKFVIYTAPSNTAIFEKYTTGGNFKIIEIEQPSLVRIKFVWKLIKLRSPIIYRHFKNYIYRKQTIKIDQNCDLLYTPTTTLYTYNSKVPNILSMHDIQHVHLPHFFPDIQLLIRKITYYLSARSSNYMQVSSSFIKEDLLSFYNFLLPRQLVLINEGVDIEMFKNTDAINNSVVSKYNIPSLFLFYPAQLWKHKDHITILKALRILKERGKSIPLVLTGADYGALNPIFSFIEKNQLENVYYLGKVPFQDIIGLYKHAKILVSASLHESSCLPILEAAASGTPIIASDIEPNCEMSKILEINLFPKQNERILSDLIQSLWENEELCERQVKHNLTNVDKYSWRNSAEKYVDLFERIYKKSI